MCFEFISLVSGEINSQMKGISHTDLCLTTSYADCLRLNKQKQFSNNQRKLSNDLL